MDKSLGTGSYALSPDNYEVYLYVIPAAGTVPTCSTV